MNECLVFFATAWGSRHGGINSFNYDLCEALAKLLAEPGHPNLKVVCIVNEGKYAEVEEAKSLGVELIVIPHQAEPTLDINSVSSQLKGCEIKPVYVLGHDVHTGLRAIKLSEHINVPVAVFHHMDYRAYKPFQGKNDKNLISRQENILKKADTVFAIGPKLEESAIDKIRGGEKEVRVIKVQPGLAEIKPVEMPSRFSTITFGRLDKENGLLKQTDLAVASFGEAVQNKADPLGQDPGLVVIGLSNEEIDEGNQSLKLLGENYAKRAVSIYGWTYNENREELFNELRGKTVCMMLSLHEGFGLVGLEAISAEVPLIISKNTGLYNAIDQTLEGEGTGCLYHVDISGSFGEKPFQDADIQKVVDCLYRIANDREKAKRNAKKLKEKLSKLWTWENAARQVLTELEDILKSTPSSDIAEIFEMDSRTIRENLQDIKQQGNPDACRQAIYETDIWLEKHPDEPYIRSKYLALVREKGSLEQQQRAIAKMSLWLQENLENCDPYVFTEYLKLIRSSGIPKEQCHEAIVQSSTWLSEHPDESYVLRQYLALVREKGKPEHSQEVISKMALWLEEPETNCDSYVFWEYLKLINQEGRVQQQQTAINQADIWFQKHPDDSYVRTEYLKLMRKQR
ncbi:MULTISPECIES: glycosyltransferase family 4 protein [unclassified Coleofasciculus]|uniref:glycosyltransferase family 4 protein n=1 Tax=unclassified Coleofasciculus TaxID=2692782 RepID=UPI001882ADA4|nr:MULTISPECIES: glycosyltransferase family 4 protein [unclassified Coleofasciculus]MBE9126226.1 glycosyltransferase family 4 protein [Coleofasciculus sp. LEGE 07081]MBE9148112.1 glycosyltransferase family 4 protein [Coleofasciculus sp. LEGE 07092]